MIARRAPLTIERRMKALDAYERAVEGQPTVEGALRAYLDTDLETHGEGGIGWRHYGLLGAQMINTAEWGAELMDAHFDVVVLRLIDILQQAMPDCPREDLLWGYHFVSVGLMLTLGRTGRIDKLSGGLCKSDDFEADQHGIAREDIAGNGIDCRVHFIREAYNAGGPSQRGGTG